jgi:hypothetical protein
LPTLACLEALNWGVMRSSPRAYGSGLVVGIKGVGGLTTHHAQEDAGSFVVQSRGESFLIDPGYFHGSAVEHTLPLIGTFKTDGKEGDIFQTAAQAPLADAWETADLRSVTVDATAAYQRRDGSKPAARVRRVLVLNGEHAVIALDQVEPVKPSDKITSLYQCGFRTEMLPGSRVFRIHGAKSDLVALVDGPPGPFSIEGPLTWKDKYGAYNPKGPQWVFASTGVKWFRVRGPYTCEPDKPRVTVLLPCDRGDAVPEIKVTREPGAIAVLLSGAAAVKFQNHDGLWKAVGPPAKQRRR